jgi:hypothetical protein
MSIPISIFNDNTVLYTSPEDFVFFIKMGKITKLDIGSVDALIGLLKRAGFTRIDFTQNNLTEGTKKAVLMTAISLIKPSNDRSDLGQYIPGSINILTNFLTSTSRRVYKQIDATIQNRLWTAILPLMDTAEFIPAFTSKTDHDQMSKLQTIINTIPFGEDCDDQRDPIKDLIETVIVGKLYPNVNPIFKTRCLFAFWCLRLRIEDGTINNVDLSQDEINIFFKTDHNKFVNIQSNVTSECSTNYTAVKILAP